MIWLIGSLVYAVAALVAAGLMAGHFAYKMAESRWSNSEPDVVQWFGAWAGALALATVWPAVLMVTAVPWRVGAERAAELKGRERRIREAERELGIG